MYQVVQYNTGTNVGIGKHMYEFMLMYNKLLSMFHVAPNMQNTILALTSALKMRNKYQINADINLKNYSVY